MNTVLFTPDVKLFVAAVRDHLADLTEEEREELVGGLEGDMSDLVAEHGVEALPEPSAYAAELRSAAGFGPEGEARRRGGRDVTGSLTRMLDGAHERWDRFAAGLPGGPWEVLVALRPVWWVLRAWVALQLVDLLWGGGSVNYGLSPVPSLLGGVGYDALVLAVAVVGSVLIGLGRVWPGRAGLGGRLVLLALNVLALSAAPAALGEVYTPAKAEAQGAVVYASGAETATQQVVGLSFNGEVLGNVYPYDAAGRPLTGVQLVDQEGRRLRTQENFTDPSSGDLTFLAPWMNGRIPLFSVFPLPEQRTDALTGEKVGEPALQAPPYASLPPVTLAGVIPSVVQATPSPSAKATPEKQANR